MGYYHEVYTIQVIRPLGKVFFHLSPARQAAKKINPNFAVLNTKKMKHLLFLAFTIATFCTQAIAQTATRQKNYNLNKGLAIEGYDPVSYFKGKPKKGTASYSVVQEGVTYHFANATNQATFKQNPTGYEPQYGGWCAYAMGAKGEKIEVDPETYKIIGSKLYLFYNSFLNNTLKKWNPDEATLKPKADANWQKINH